MKLEFDEWCDVNHDQVMSELDESGASREMDFDPEMEMIDRYAVYLHGE